MDLSTVRKHLNLLFAEKDESEFIELRIIGKSVKSRFFSKIDEVINFLKSTEISGKHIYVGINPRSEQKGTSESVKRAKFLVADIDYSDKSIPLFTESVAPVIGKVKLNPCMVVFSGKKGYHIYIQLSEWITTDKWKELQKRLNATLIKHGLPADIKIQDTPRVIRLAGTEHPETKNEAKIMYYNPEEKMDVSELEKILVELPTPQEVENYVFSKEELKNISVKKRKLIDFLKSIWVEGSRQQITFYIAGYLRKKGWLKDDVEDVIKTVCAETGDTELKQRMDAIRYSFEKEEDVIKGISGIEEELRTILRVLNPDADEKTIETKLSEKLDELKEIVGQFHTPTIRSRVSSGRWFVNSARLGIFMLKEKKDDYYFENVFSGHIKSIRIVNETLTKEETYELVFSQYGKEFKVVGDVEDIVNALKKRAGVKSQRLLRDAISSLIDEYKRRGIAVVEEKPFNAYGFWLDGDVIRWHGIYENTMLYENVTKEELRNGLKKLEELIDVYTSGKGELREKTFNILYWGLCAPFGFARKQKKGVSNILIVVGPSGTGKTFSFELIANIWGIDNLDCKVAGVTISYPARLGARLAKSTFPILADEGGKVFARLSDPEDELVEMFKLMAESIYDARSHAARSFPPLRTVGITANYDLPKIPDALRNRLIVVQTSVEEQHTKEERAQIMAMLNEASHELIAIGSYILKLLHDETRNREITKIILQPNMLKAGRDLFKLVLEEAGLDIPLPSTMNIGYYEDVEEKMDDLEMIFSCIDMDMMDLARMRIVDNRNIVNKREMYERLIDDNVLPAYLYRSKSGEFLVITSNIKDSVVKRFGAKLEVGGIKNIAQVYKLTYQPRDVIDKAGVVRKKKGIVISREELIARLCPAGEFETTQTTSTTSPTQGFEIFSGQTESQGSSGSSGSLSSLGSSGSYNIKDKISKIKERLETDGLYFAPDNFIRAYIQEFGATERGELAMALEKAGFDDADNLIDFYIQMGFIYSRPDGKIDLV